MEHERETKGKRMGRRRKKKERWIQHYRSSQKILLVGEGDFSFSVCLATAFGSAVNMVATSLDSKEMLSLKYQSSEAHLEELKRRGCVVLHGVDVNNMNIHPTLKKMKFDIIIYNFPHAGHFSWLCERDTQLIEMHKELLKGYFTSAGKMVSEGGEIHVTHRDDYPYNTWELEKLAGKTSLQLKEKVEFRRDDYPGYYNKRGCHFDSNGNFPLKDCFTFKFTTTTLQKKHEDNQMASSCISSNSQIKCDCGDIAQIWTSWAGKNMGRQFVRCPNYLTNSCGFFDLVDPTKLPHEKLYDLYVQIQDLEKKYEEEVNKAEEGKKSCEEMEKNYTYVKNKYEENEKTIEEWKKYCDGVEKNYKNMQKRCEENKKTIEEWKKYCDRVEKNYKNMQKKCEEEVKMTEELKRCYGDMEMNYKDVKKKYEEKVKTIEEWKKYSEMLEKDYKDMKRKCEEILKTTEELCDKMEKKYEDMKKKNNWKRNIIVVSMIAVFYYLSSKSTKRRYSYFRF